VFLNLQVLASHVGYELKYNTKCIYNTVIHISYKKAN